MGKTISYIFVNLEASDSAVKNIRKTLKNQAKFNRRFAVLVLLMTAYMITTEKYNNELSKRVHKMNVEIEELKRMKGD